MVIMIMRIAIIVSISLIGAIFGHASSIVSNERASLDSMSSAMKAYARTTNAEQITNWTQLQKIFNLAASNHNIQATRGAGYTLENHYDFITQPLPLPKYEGSQILLVRTVPLQDAEGGALFRYLIVRTKDGYVSVIQLHEDKVKEMFENAGVSLPVPKPGLAAVETERLPSAEEIYEQTKPAATPSSSPVAPSGPTPIKNDVILKKPAQSSSPAIISSTPEPLKESHVVEKPKTSILVTIVGGIAVVIIGGVSFLLYRRKH